ncbi:MAG: hypothetical protein AB1697_02740 [Pseudomonadota bacterium]
MKNRIALVLLASAAFGSPVFADNIAAADPAPHAGQALGQEQRQTLREQQRQAQAGISAEERAALRQARQARMEKHQAQHRHREMRHEHRHGAGPRTGRGS